MIVPVTLVVIVSIQVVKRVTMQCLNLGNCQKKVSLKKVILINIRNMIVPVTLVVIVSIQVVKRLTMQCLNLGNCRKKFSLKKVILINISS